ncbi:MAG: hypothetical protein ACJA2S_000368 [Cyclobacteriaceae bacterium]|jgi:hypothetical protein
MKNNTIKKLSIGLVLVILTLSVYTYFSISNKQTEREATCFEKLAVKLSDGASPDSIYQVDFGKLQLLVEYSLVARSEMLEVSNRLRENTDKPISSRDLVVLKTGTEDYLDIREDLYDIANNYECAIDAEESTLVKYNIEPELRLKGLMLSLGAALTLYDNYMLGTIMFEQDSRLRKVINDPDMGFGLVSNKLAEMTLAANSVDNRHRIRRVIKFYEEQKASLENVHEDSDLSYLRQLIESSPSYNYVKKIKIKEIASGKFGAFERITEDMVTDASAEGFDMLSGLFGNTVGMYESRKGKLNGDTEAIKKIKSVLQPLDILLEKTPFRLTDKLIPGHFGHVAIWTGTQAELVDIGVWDNQIVKQYTDEINESSNPDSKEGNQVIEALRNGVQLSTLEHFMNIDDLAILRPIFNENSKKETIEEALIMAFRQLGKKYDFNFDVNTTDKIVCSELAYVSFPSIDWPTEKVLGRYSISPDNVAQLAWNNVPLQLVMFYHDGKLVSKDQQVDKMRALMQQ